MLLNLLCSLGPVGEVYQNLPYIKRCAQNSIRKCGGEVYRKVRNSVCMCKHIVYYIIHHVASIEFTHSVAGLFPCWSRI